MPLQANFIFHEIKGDVKTYNYGIREHDIVVGREFLPIKGFSLISPDTSDEMTVFIEELKSFLEKS